MSGRRVEGLRQVHFLTGARQADFHEPESKAKTPRLARVTWGMANAISGEGSRPLEGSEDLEAGAANLSSMGG